MRIPKLEEGIFTFTDGSYCVGPLAYPGIPILIWPDGIDEVASDWFRSLAVVTQLANSTVLEYANVLRPFLRFCRRNNRDWRTVDDEFLILWRDTKLSQGAASTSRVNDCIQRVFAFYVWAESERILQHHVGIYTPEELGPGWSNRRFPLTAARSYSRIGYGMEALSWRSTVKARKGNQSGFDRHTPTEDEAQELQSILLEGSQGHRNSLIMSWAEETGARRFEILQMRVDQLPTIEQVADLIDRDKNWPVPLVRKGGKAHWIYMSPKLTQRALNYVMYDRARVVAQCRIDVPGYREPAELFLSSKTGKVLHRDSVTTISRRAFQKAGIKQASIHRLRAMFIVRKVTVEVDAVHDGLSVGSDTSWMETILFRAAEMMGHSSPASLKPYLHKVLERRLKSSLAMRREKMKSDVRNLESEIKLLERRLKLLDGEWKRRS